MQSLTHLADKAITIQRHEYVSMPGSVDTNIYYIENGSLRVYVLDNDEEQIIRFGYTDNLIVSLDSFLTNKPTVFYIQAIKKTVLKVISKKRWEEFLSHHENQKVWTSILENLILQQLEREIDILTTSPKERYLRVLSRSPRLFQEIPHRYIANYLRMSAETLSRLKKS
jgi:CRP-like cAMP-binding protein